MTLIKLYEKMAKDSMDDHIDLNLHPWNLNPMELHFIEPFIREFKKISERGTIEKDLLISNLFVAYESNSFGIQTLVRLLNSSENQECGGNMDQSLEG